MRAGRRLKQQRRSRTLACEISYELAQHLAGFPLWFGRVRVLPGYKVKYPHGAELFCVGISQRDVEEWCKAFDTLPSLHRG